MYIPVSSSGIQLPLESETSVDHSLSPFLLLGPMQREEEIAPVSVAQISNFVPMLCVLSPNSLLKSATSFKVILFVSEVLGKGQSSASYS